MAAPLRGGEGSPAPGAGPEAGRPGQIRATGTGRREARGDAAGHRARPGGNSTRAADDHTGATRSCSRRLGRMGELAVAMRSRMARGKNALTDRGESVAEATWLWITSPRVTVAVLVANGMLVNGPPIVRRHIGQSLHELRDRFRVDDVQILQ